MTYKDITEYINSLYPSEYTSQELRSWIREVNADILRNIEKNNKPAFIPQESEQVLIPAPYDDMYRFYLLAQIAYAQRDFDLYNRHISAYQARRNDYMGYYLRTVGQKQRTKFKNWIGG